MYPFVQVPRFKIEADNVLGEPVRRWTKTLVLILKILNPVGTFTAFEAR
jgi:hypothetical protein